MDPHGTDRPASEAPFSELIRRWWDEGDRLSEVPARTEAEAGGRKRLHELGASLRQWTGRHRLVVMAGAGLLSALGVVALRFVARAEIAAGATPPADVVLVASAPAATPMAAVAPRPTAAAAVPVPVVAPGPAVVVAPAPAPAPEPVSDPEPASRREPVSEAAPAPRVEPPSEPEPVAKKVEPPSAPAPAALSADEGGGGSLLQTCKRALDKERTRDALAACGRFAAAAPGSVEAIVSLARADLLAGREAETLRLARRASALDPRCAEAYLLIGTASQLTGRKPDARTAYQAYLHLAPRGLHAAEVRAILRTL